jgi:hypothetical protein
MSHDHRRVYLDYIRDMLESSEINLFTSILA